MEHRQQIPTSGMSPKQHPVASKVKRTLYFTVWWLPSWIIEHLCCTIYCTRRQTLALLLRGGYLEVTGQRSQELSFLTFLPLYPFIFPPFQLNPSRLLLRLFATLQSVSSGKGTHKLEHLQRRLTSSGLPSWQRSSLGPNEDDLFIRTATVCLFNPTN